MIFPEFMAEMRRPRDFWKAAFCAQFFCYALYMAFGIYVYSWYVTLQFPSVWPTDRAGKVSTRTFCQR